MLKNIKPHVIKNLGNYILFDLIINKKVEYPFIYVVADIHDGEVDYWDMNNNKMSYSFIYDNRHSEYERTLPNTVKEYLYNIAANQTEEIENNKNIKTESIKMNKKRIILSESQLHRIIKECVKNALNEDMDAKSNPGPQEGDVIETKYGKATVLKVTQSEITGRWNVVLRANGEYGGRPLQTGDDGRNPTIALKKAIKRFEEKAADYEKHPKSCERPSWLTDTEFNGSWI